MNPIYSLKVGALQSAKSAFAIFIYLSLNDNEALSCLLSSHISECKKTDKIKCVKMLEVVR